MDPTDRPTEDDEGNDRFERLARNAAASLQRPPPVDGLATITTAARRQRLNRTLGVTGMVGVLVVGGLIAVRRTTDDQPDAQANTPTTTTAEPAVIRTDASDTTAALDTTVSPTTGAPTSTLPDGALEPELHGWLSDYVGSQGSSTTGEPLRVGVFHPGPYSTEPLRITADYVNSTLSGAAGRPLELVECTDTAAVCADRFAADDSLVVVLEPESDSLSVELAGRKPELALVPDNGRPSFHSTGIEDMNAFLLAGADAIQGISAPSVVVVDAFGGDQFGGMDGLRALVQREFPNAAVLEFSANPVEFVDRLRTAAPDGIDLLIVNLWFPVCEAVREAVETIGATPVVFANVCTPIEGWHQASLGYNLSEPDLASGGLSISTLLDEAGFDPVAAGDPLFAQDGRVFSTRAAATLLTVVKLANGIGDGVSPQSLSDALASFTGTPGLAGGPVDCTQRAVPADRRLPGSCVRFVDMYRAEGGRWVTQPPVDLAS